MSEARWTRVREDGRVFCPRCAARGAAEPYRPVEEFGPSHKPSPNASGARAYCRACDRAYRMEAYYRAPERYRQEARTRPKPQVRAANRRYRARKRAELDAEKAELQRLALAAMDWLKGRGLWDHEIADLAQISHDTILRWRRGAPLMQRRPAERVLRLLRCAGDLPAWTTRRRGEGHPLYAVLRARMAVEGD